jgi:RNA polymerase sigma-70 factor (ECF subfamily)
VDATAAERDLLRKLVDASEKGDISAFASLIREDAVFRMPPNAEIAVGREAMLRLWLEAGFGTEAFGRLRCVVTRANRQPALAYYVLRSGDTAYSAMALDVFRVEEGIITEIVVFRPEVFPAFGLPLVLDAHEEAAQ